MLRVQYEVILEMSVVFIVHWSFLKRKLYFYSTANCSA